MIKKILLVSSIFSTGIFVFSGCEQQPIKKSTIHDNYPEKIKLKIKNNELVSNDVIEMFNREKSFKDNESGFAFDNGMKKIKHSKDFKTDVNQLFSRLAATMEYNPGMRSKNFPLPKEHSKKIDEVLRVTDATTEVTRLNELREKLIGGEAQSLQGERYIQDFYLHREKHFIQLNNKIVDFRKKYLIKYNDDYEKSEVLHQVADDYTAFLIGLKMKIFAEKNKSSSKKSEQKGIDGMKKSEAFYFSTYSENLMHLSKNMGSEVVD